MNHGNPLSSLLGITGTHPAMNQASAAKARAESSEKFQQTFEQVRPDVAARKPVGRKESPVPNNSSALRAESKPVAQRTSAAETKDTGTTATTANHLHDATDKRLDKPEPLNRAAAGNQEADTENTKSPVDERQQILAGTTSKDEGNGEQSAIEAPSKIDSLLVMEPALVITDEALVAPANPIGFLDAGLVDDLAVEDEQDPLIHNEIATLDPGILTLQPARVSIAPDVPSGEADVLTGTNDDSLVSTPYSNQATDAQVASEPSIPNAAMQSTVTHTASGVQPGQMMQDESVADDANTAGDVSTADVGENPDFLLLNSKAALNKLTEASMAAATLDKAAPADVAKPVSASAAIESLARLSEPQSPAARAFIVQTGVPVNVGSPQWSQAVGDKVLWLAAQNVSAAEIRLDPPELGPMQVRVSINQDQASVTFTSPHPAVREALDQQLNRLREMFSEQGLNLVNVDVSDKSFAQREREQNESKKHQRNSEQDDEALTSVGITQTISMRLVDHYA